MELDKVKGIIADVLEIDADEITADSEFQKDLAANSLDIIQIVTEIETEFDIKIPDDALESIVTVGDAVKRIKEAKA